MTSFTFNDGGRAEAGYKGRTGDCVTRAVAIAASLPSKKFMTDLLKATLLKERPKGHLKVAVKEQQEKA